MIEEKVISYFNRFPELRILFFFDEEREYEEEVKALELSDIYVEVWENNPFVLKYKLLEEHKHNKVFLYLPIKQPIKKEDFQNFPLTGLLLANKELQLDDVGEFMETFQLQRHQKPLVSKYMKELKYKKVQDVCKTVLKPGSFQESSLQQGLISSFLNFNQIESRAILIGKLLTLTNDKEEKNLNRFIKKIQDNNLEEVVIEYIKRTTGFSINKINLENLLDIARFVLYNKLTQSIPEISESDPYGSLKVEEAYELIPLNQLLQEVERHSQLKPSFDELMERVGKDIRGEKLIEVYGEDADFYEYNSEMVWAIITKIQSHLDSSPLDYIKKLELLSLQTHLPETVLRSLKYLIQVAKTYQYIPDNSAYVLDTPEEYVDWYVKELYKIDSSYRRAVLEKKSINITEIPVGFEIDAVHDKLNQAYDQHTDVLNREWLRCLNHFNFDYSKINIAKQYDFYKTEVAPKDQKVVVIISDALRYEAGIELLSQMHADAQNTAEMKYMLASIPSKTNIGMAQLLPGKNFDFAGGNIKIDGVSASSTHRTEILQKAEQNSLALRYGDLEDLKRAEIRDIFKNDVVFVYHDVIDATGDSRSSERRTFDAVKDAVEELQRFVARVHHTYNVAKVYITADHGFLYNDKKVEDKDLEDLPSLDVVLSHNRYYATLEKDQRDLGYSIPLSATTKFEDDIYITIPLSVNRYRKQGVGHQFVHGGGSLQELIVPLIESSRKREEVAKKVNPMILQKAEKLRVVSNILKFNILQENEISRMEKERTILVGLYKGTTLASNQEEIILNSTSESPSERLYSVELLLNTAFANETFLKLKIFDKEDQLNALIEEQIQNRTIIPTDF